MNPDALTNATAFVGGLIYLGCWHCAKQAWLRSRSRKQISIR